MAEQTTADIAEQEPTLSGLLARIRDTHRKLIYDNGAGFEHTDCGYCDVPWPCDAIQLADAVELRPYACKSGHSDWPLIWWNCPTCVYKIATRETHDEAPAE